MRLVLKHNAILAVMAWARSVGRKTVFNFNTTIPLHATFCSSSLMLNMLAGYWLLEKLFTWQ